MTIPELKALAQERLDFGVAQIRETGQLIQRFYLVKYGGTLEGIMLGGDITNSKSAKAALGMTLKVRVAAGGIEAVIMLSDVYFSTISNENEAIRRRLNMNVEESAAFGLCERHEGVLVTLESPILAQWTRQEYRRDGKTIRLIGAPWTRDNTDPSFVRLTGNFVNFFPQKAATS